MPKSMPHTVEGVGAKHVLILIFFFRLNIYWVLLVFNHLHPDVIDSR